MRRGTELTQAPHPSSNAQATAQQRAKTKKDKALIAALVAVFVTGAVGYGLMITIRSALLAWGLSEEVALWLAKMVADKTFIPDLGVGKPGPMFEHEAEQLYAWRALYILAASQRLAQVDAEGIDHAERLEVGYFARHLAAEMRRLRAAALSDVASRLMDDRTEEQGSEKIPLLGWRAVVDAKTTPECKWANGKNYRADRIPVIGLPGAVHLRCFPAGTLVSSPAINAATSRWYCGEIVEVTTSSGDLLTVTPNHPILTPQGWVPAGLLDEGRHVVRTSFGDALSALIDPDDYQRPAFIEDVVRAFDERSGVRSRTVPVTAEDFHGDGSGSQIAVVRSYGVLMDGLDTAQSQPGVVEQFVGASRGLAMFRRRPLATLLEGEPSARDCDVSRLRIAGVLLGRALGHHQPVGLGLASAFDPVVDEYGRYTGAGDAERLGNLVLAHSRQVEVANIAFGQSEFGQSSSVATASGLSVPLGVGAQRAALREQGNQRPFGDVQPIGNSRVAEVARLIKFDRIVKVRRWSSWSGHVYNLESSAGWYVSDNIIAHNCRCTPGPATPGAPLIPSV